MFHEQESLLNYKQYKAKTTSFLTCSSFSVSAYMDKNKDNERRLVTPELGLLVKGTVVGSRGLGFDSQ